MEQLFFEMQNQYRIEQGLRELTYDQTCYEAAAIRNEEIAAVFFHTRPDGREWYTVNEDVCYGENLASGYFDAEEVLLAWIDSPSHKKIILTEDYTKCGVAEKDGYWTCIFSI